MLVIRFYSSTLPYFGSSALLRKQIVAQIEEEQKLVEANRTQIEIFEGKIEAEIAEVWGE